MTFSKLLMPISFFSVFIKLQMISKNVHLVIFGSWLLLICFDVLHAQVMPKEKKAVVTSIRPIELIVKSLSGDLYSTRSVVGGSQSPHHITLKPSQLKSIRTADLFIWVDPEFEYFLTRSVKTLHENKVLRLSTLPSLQWPDTESEHVHSDHERSSSHGHRHDGHDFHLWLDPRNTNVIVESVAKKLISLDRKNEQLITERKTKLLRALNDIESRWLVEFARFEEVPYIAFHAAYGHFENFVNLHASITVNDVPDEQISARQLRQLKQSAGNSVCMLADQSEGETATKLAKRLGLPLVSVDLLASNTSDYFESFETYLEVFATTFKRCFQA